MNEGLPRKLTRHDENVLAIPVGMKRKGFALTRFAALKNSPGWIVGPKEINEWNFSGFFETEGEVFFYGPYHGGILLGQIINLEPEKALPYLLKLVKALSLLKEKGITLDHIQTDSVYFLHSGEVFFLPPRVMLEVLKTRPLKYKLRAFEAINHPDLPKGEEQLSFNLSALLYRILAGEFPFQADTEEEIHNRIRNLKIPSLCLMIPELKDQVAEIINRSFGKKLKPPLLPGDWIKRLEEWIKDGLFQSILDSEKRALLQKGLNTLRQAKRSYEQKIFWQRHWKTILIVLASLIIAGSVSGSFIKNLLAPRSTRGYSPLGVVETFYQSINRLDHTRMEDCVIGSAGKAIIKEVINIYVISRVSMGYEGKSHLLPADEWEQMGKPDLMAPETIFGITQLYIREIEQEPHPVFIATYQRWIPSRTDSDQDLPVQSLPRYQGFQITDNVSLKQDKGDWVIYRLEQLESKPLQGIQ